MARTVIPETAGEASSTPRPAIVEVRDLVIGYDQQPVLNQVSLTVRPGEVVAILGGSGSGKSTLLKAILGLLTPLEGSVHVMGTDMVRASSAERDEVYRNLGMVYQQGALFSSMTVAENIAWPLREHSDREEHLVEITVRMKLGLVNLGGFGDRFPDQLSGGQAKRVAFARAIALDPPLLLCDEPSAGLDPRIARGIDDLIRNLNHAFDMAVVVVTHDMESVKVIADRIIMLAPRPGGARVTFSGTYEEMLQCAESDVRDFVLRKPLLEPRAEAAEVFRQLALRD